MDIRTLINQAYLMLFLSLVPLLCSAADPRAWLAIKGGKQVVLVGETHQRSAIEFDGYYDAVVRTSFLAADVAMLEGFGMVPQKDDRLYWTKPCHDEVVGQIGKYTDRLKPAVDELVVLARKSNVQVPDGLLYSDILSGYFLWSTDFPNMELNIGRAARKTYSAKYKDADFAGVAMTFRRLADKDSVIAKKLRPLDFSRDGWKAFCSVSGSARQELLLGMVDGVKKRLEAMLADPEGRQISANQALFGRSLLENLSCVDRKEVCAIPEMYANSEERKRQFALGWMVRTPGYLPLSIVGRNHTWMPLILDQVAQNDKVFVIVGSLHLPTFQVEGKVEPGLIDLLRAQGFTVRPILSAADIQDSFLKPRK